jgi:hypothetical protein
VATITITNNGPGAAQNVTLSDTLPTGTTFVSQSQTSGLTFTLSNTSNQVSDSIATLPAGASATFSVTALVGAGVASGTALSNTATTSSSTADPNTANNGATATTTVTSPPPVLTNPGNQTNAFGDVVSLPIHASDPSGAPLSFGESDLPPGLTINAQTGVVSGTTINTHAQLTGNTYPVTLTAYDTLGGSASQTFNWTVTGVSAPPSLTNPGGQVNAENDGVALPLTATDPGGLPLTYSATGLPPGLSINASSGRISGAISSTAAANSPYSVTVSASDGVATSPQTFTWTVQRIRVDNPGQQTDLESDAVSLPINAWEPAGAALAYSVTGLPAGLSIGAASGLISGTVTAGTASPAPYNVTVTASDGTSSAGTTFAWTVGTFALATPGDQTNAEGDSVSLAIDAQVSNGQALAYGATGLPPGLTIDSATGLISGTVASQASNSGPYGVTVSASDGTTSQLQTFTWTVTSILLTDPGEQIGTPGGAVTLPILATDPAGHALTFAASQLPPGLSISPSTGTISGTLSAGAAASSPYAVTVTASDGTDTASLSISWVVVNGLVSVSNPGTQASAEGAGVSLQVVASDMARDPLTFDAIGLPSGLAIDAGSGLISGTLDYGAAATSGGTYQVTVLADNGQGGTGSTTFTWQATHTNQAPVVDSPGDQANLVGDVVSLPVLAYDPDGDTLGYTASGLPTGLSIDPGTGVISGTVAAGAVTGSPYNVTVTASDGTLSASQTFRWAVANGAVSVTAPADQANAEGDVVSVSVSASNPAGLPLTFAATGLPAGVSINTATGQIAGTVSSTAAETAGGQYTVTVTASDSQGDSGVAQFAWAVTHTDQGPALTNPGNQTAAEGNTVSLQVQASDPDGYTLVYTAGGLPAGLTIDPLSGLISGEVDYSAAEVSGGHYSVRVAVNDGAGHTASQTFTWTVTDTNLPPWLNNPGPQGNDVSDVVSLPMFGGDADGDPLTYSATGLPTGLSISATTGLISGTVANTATGTYTPTVSVSDGSQQVSQSFSWQINVPHITLAINNTLDPSDDVGLVDPSVPVPVRVTLSGASSGLHQVTLNLGSSPRSSIDVPSLQLTNGGSMEVTLTPLTSSLLADDMDLVAMLDGKQAGDQKVTNVVVTFPDPIKNSDTPAGMKDRIPPGVPTTVAVKLSVDLSAVHKLVWIKVGGDGNDNGKVSFIPSSTNQLQNVMPADVKDDKVRIQGTKQTEPGHAGNLFLTASSESDVNITNGPKSSMFSVAAIPIAVRMYDPKKFSGAETSKPADANYKFNWGLDWSVQFISDSDPTGTGNAKDLDQVELSEMIKRVPGAKGAADYLLSGNVVGDFFPPSTTDPGKDATSTTKTAPKMLGGEPVSVAVARALAAEARQETIADKGNGTGAVVQNVVFIDNRTGYTDKDHPLMVKNSGFRIQMTFEKDSSGKYFIKVKRTAEANNGAEGGQIAQADTAEVSDEIK